MAYSVCHVSSLQSGGHVGSPLCGRISGPLDSFIVDGAMHNTSQVFQCYIYSYLQALRHILLLGHPFAETIFFQLLGRLL